MRRYSKALGSRTWGIVRRPVWNVIVVITTLYTLLEFLDRVLLERLVSFINVLNQWWYVPLTVLVLLVLLRAGYELWTEEEQKRKRAESQLTRVQAAYEELRRENEELIAESESRPSPLPDTLAEWLETTPLITVPNQTYRNDRIELDGFHYERCVFEDCTFSFKGTKPFRVAESCRVKGMVNIDARGPQAQAMLVFMKQLGALHPNSQWYDFYDGRLIED